MGKNMSAERGAAAARNPLGRGINLAGQLVRVAMLGLFAVPALLLHLLLEGGGRGLRGAGRLLLRASRRWYRFSTGVIDSVR